VKLSHAWWDINNNTKVQTWPELGYGRLPQVSSHPSWTPHFSFRSFIQRPWSISCIMILLFMKEMAMEHMAIRDTNVLHDLAADHITISEVEHESQYPLVEAGGSSWKWRGEVHPLHQEGLGKHKLAHLPSASMMCALWIEPHSVLSGTTGILFELWQGMGLGIGTVTLWVGLVGIWLSDHWTVLELGIERLLWVVITECTALLGQKLGFRGFGRSFSLCAVPTYYWGLSIS